jgi:hypothetical protein
MASGAATLSAICPCPRELSWPGTRTATDTVRRNILTCANIQERLHYDQDSSGSSKRRLCRVAGGMTPRRQVAGAVARGHLRSTWSLPERLAELLSDQLRQHHLQPSDRQAGSAARQPGRPDWGRAGDLRSRRAAGLVTGRRRHRPDRLQAAAGRRLRRDGRCLCLPVAGARGDHYAAGGSCCCSARRTSSPSSGRTPPGSCTPPILLCPDLRSGRPRRPGPGIITAGVSHTGSVLWLTPPMRGQPFQAGCGVFACLGLAPEQLVGLGQH